MDFITVDGSTPLTGNVRLSGARNSALKLIPASMFSNEDIILENVPRVKSVLAFVDLIQSLGGYAEWGGSNRLILNGASLNSYEITTSGNLYYRVAALLVAPLVYRFGRAIINKGDKDTSVTRPLNRWLDTWKSLGYEVTEDEKTLKVEGGKLTPGDVSFRISTHSGTDNAILSTLFLNGESTINNAAEESEIEDLIEFCNVIGGEVERVEPRKIKVLGKSVFRGGRFSVQSDKNEAVAIATAALMTNGNVTIQGVDKLYLTPFINVLSKIGCHFEFSGDDLLVWSSEGENWQPVNIQSSHAPGLVSDWLPYLTLLLTKAEGESTVYDTVFADRLSFIKELNGMGAGIDLVTPSTVDLQVKVSDDSYNLQKLGEPFTVARVNGPVGLRPAKVTVSDINSSAVAIIAALSVPGRSEIHNWDYVNSLFEGFVDKLHALKAKIY